MSKIRPKDRRQLSQGMVRFTNPKLKEFGKIINCGQPCLQSGTARPHKQCTLESSMSQPGAANQNGQTGGMGSELWTFCHPSSEIGRPNTRLGSALLSRASQVGGEEDGCLKTREAMSDIGVREVVPQVCRTGQPQVPTASRRPKGTSDFTAYLRSPLAGRENLFGTTRLDAYHLPASRPIGARVRSRSISRPRLASPRPETNEKTQSPHFCCRSGGRPLSSILQCFPAWTSASALSSLSTSSSPDRRHSYERRKGPGHLLSRQPNARAELLIRRGQLCRERRRVPSRRK